MTTEARWGAYDTIVSYLGSTMNSLADAALLAGAAIDFTASGVDRKQYLDVEIYLASYDISTKVNPAIYLWVLSRTDGTNYEDGSASVIPARPPDAIFPLRAVSGAQRVFQRMIITTPDLGTILIQNKSGLALASSGNTVKYYTYGVELV
jgi:hypothetical protein